MLKVGSGDDGLLLADRVFLVDGEAGGEVEVEDEALVMEPEASAPEGDWQPDDLLISDEGAGFLRRVVDVEELGGETIVHTEPASLAEVMAYGSIDTSIKPFSEGLRLDGDVELGDLSGRAASLGAKDLAASVDAQAIGGGLDYEFEPTVLAEAAGVELRLDGGYFRFDPTLDVDLDLGFFRIDRFEVLARGDVDAEVELSLVAEIDESLSETTQLWQSPAYAWNGKIGPVPVVIVSQLTLDATVDARVAGPTSVSVVAGAGGFAELGAVFDSGWKASGDRSFEARFEGPEIQIDTELDAMVRLDGTLEVKLYKVIAPTVTVSPWAQVQANDTALTVDVGVEGRAGGRIASYPLDLQLFDWQDRVVDQPF